MSKSHSLLSATLWTVAARWTDRLLGLGSIAILSRLLTPEQFGLVATASIVALAIEMFFSLGLDWALVRLPKMTDGHMSTAWTLRVCTGTVCALALAASSFAISQYFGDARITSIVLVLSGAILVGSLENPGMAEFRRRLDFRAEYAVTLGSKIAGFVVAATLAFAYRTYWALPLGVLTSKVATVALSFFLHPFRPKWRLVERGELLSFSLWSVASTVVNYFRVRSAELVVAKQLGLISLGHLRIANELAETAANELGGPINRALFSEYSGKSMDAHELRTSFAKTTSLVWCVALPVAIGIGLLGHHAIRIIFGDQWNASAELVGILCVANGMSLMSTNASSLLWSIGHTALATYLSTALMVLFLVLLLVLIPIYALAGSAYAIFLTAAIGLPLTIAITCKKIDLGFVEFMRGKWRLLIGLTCMSWIVLQLRPESMATEMAGVVRETIALALAGALTYVSTTCGLWLIAGRPDGPESVIWNKIVKGILLRRFSE